MMDTEILKQQVTPNAREYIERLEAELSKVTAERDAAKADIREILIHEFVCEYCKHYNMIGCAPKCKEIAEWRGVQAKEDKTNATD